MNILDTIDRQMATWVFNSPKLCFCTTWGKENKRNVALLFHAVWLLD